MADEDNVLEGVDVEEGAEEAPVKKTRVRGTVRVVSMSDSNILGRDNAFKLELISVGNKPYVFENQSDALKWITRRDYNGETLSDNTRLLHEALTFVRTARQILKVVLKVEVFLNTLNLEVPAPFARADVQNKRIAEAIIEVPSRPACFEGFFDALEDLGTSMASMASITDKDQWEEAIEERKAKVQALLNFDIPLSNCAQADAAPIEADTE